MNYIKLLWKEFEVIKRYVRRELLLFFRKGYVLEQMRRRKGACGRHGCCDLTRLSRLLHKKCLSRIDRTECMLWPELPRECKYYPIDEADKIPETVKYCNFYWE